MTDQGPLTDLQRGVLALVRDGGDQASWHWLGTRAPSLGFPVPDVMPVLQELARRGLVARTLVGGGMDRWALTEAGRAALQVAEGRSPQSEPRGFPGAAEGRKAAPGAPGTAEGQQAPAGPSQAAGLRALAAEDRPIPPGPLGAAELRALAAALSADAVTSTTALVPLINDGPRLRAALLQVVALDPANARAAAGASLFLRPGDQADFAREMMEDPRPGVRAALFQAWAPPRMDVPGQAIPTLDPPALEALLRGGLLDPSREVRAAAAAYAFATGRGASVVGELMVNLEAPERELRWWTILALGGARDELSLHALEQIAAEPDVAAAGAAIRALAARPDGHPAWLRVLEGPDGELRRAALFGLAEVARGIAPEAIARLAKDPREDVQRVLARYRARTVARS